MPGSRSPLGRGGASRCSAVHKPSVNKRVRGTRRRGSEGAAVVPEQEPRTVSLLGLAFGTLFALGTRPAATRFESRCALRTTSWLGAKTPLKITRIYSGDDGESHFEDVEIPLRDLGEIGRLSKREKATGIVFRETDGDYAYDYHCAPRRQYVINLDSPVEVEVGDGTKRVIGAGEILLAEDTTGRGHISRSVDGRPRRSLLITID